MSKSCGKLKLSSNVNIAVADKELATALMFYQNKTKSPSLPQSRLTDWKVSLNALLIVDCWTYNSVSPFQCLFSLSCAPYPTQATKRFCHDSIPVTTTSQRKNQSSSTIRPPSEQASSCEVPRTPAFNWSTPTCKSPHGKTSHLTLDKRHQQAMQAPAGRKRPATARGIA